MVVFHRHSWWLFVEVSAPGEARVHIFGIAISVEFPHTGHRHLSPLRVVEVGFVEVGGSLVGILHPVEFPCAVEREKSCRLAHVALHGQGFVFKGKEVCVHVHAVHFVHLQVVPLGECGLRLRCRGRCCLFLGLGSVAAQGKSQQGSHQNSFLHRFLLFML